MGLFVDRRLRLYFACGLRGGALSAASVATRNNKFKLPTASAGSSGMNKKLSTTALGLILALSVSAAVEAKTLVFCSEGSPEGFNPQFYTAGTTRSEEHTSELQSLLRISYAVFCLKKKNT